MSKWRDEEALAFLREQMGEGWSATIHQFRNGAYELSAYTTHRQRVRVVGQGPDPMSAARACVDAWREATRRDVMPCNCAELPAERAHADRLAEALQGLNVAAITIHDSPGVLRVFQEVLHPNIVTAAYALAAHDARRGKEGA